MITTRKVNSEDAPKVLPLLKEFFLQTKHHLDHGVPWIEEDTSDVLDYLIGNEDVAVIVAEDEEGSILGTTAGLKSPLWLAPSSSVGVELFWYVYPKHRTTTAGKKLFSALESWAVEAGCDSLSMIALEHLQADRVARIYQLKGYEPIERAFIKRL